jgi:hypothetical protein
VNTFDLVLSDDGVLERSTIGEDEDRIRVVTFHLASAGNTAAVGLETSVESTRYLHGLLECLGAGRGGDRERGTLGHALREVSTCLTGDLSIEDAH